MSTPSTTIFRSFPFRPLLLPGVLLAVCGCGTVPASVPAPEAGAGTGSVAIVVAADRLESAPSRKRMNRLLEQAFVVDGRPRPVPGAMVALALGNARFDQIGDEIARYGVLSTETRRDLLAMPIPVRRALVVRLERNDTEVLEPRTEPALGTDGQRLVDRDVVVLARRRNLRIAASLTDLSTGKRVWARAWQAGPVTAMRYENYTGSSLAAGVAVALTNTVISGLDGPSAPPALDTEEALAALFRTLADEMPER